ncbi:C5a anaphylatoxin chemotactic receptor 1 [Hydra vulgaris]|uniref:C5a anaphylatoxin chemotactic receptor 1 n=1 Tax=Hydra vulgaris TaxID=6087 RepID=A0ABM4CDP1_HYDVU
MKISENALTTPLKTSEWILVVAFGLIFLTGVVGNAFVIYVFGYKRKSKPRVTADWLILYLGFADFLSSCLNPPLYMYYTFTRYQVWHFGIHSCKILPALGSIMSSISIVVLLIFAIDRYLAIISPLMGSALSWKTITIAFTGGIVVSICMHLNYVLSLEVIPNNDYITCQVSNVKKYSYAIPTCLTIFFRFVFCVLIFSFTTVQIMLTLKKCREKSFSSEQRQRFHKKSKKTLYVLLLMNLVFFFLVFPKEVLVLIHTLSWIVKKEGIYRSPMLLELNAWLKLLHTANSCANVFIYSQMHNIYRKEITQFFLKFFCHDTLLKLSRQKCFIKQSIYELSHSSLTLQLQHFRESKRKKSSMKLFLVSKKVENKVSFSK